MKKLQFVKLKISIIFFSIIFIIFISPDKVFAFLDMSQILEKMKSYHNIDVINYNIDATIITKDKTAIFKTDILFKSKEENLLKVIFFLGNIFHIESIKKENMSLKFGTSSFFPGFYKIVRVFLDSPLKKDEKCLLTFNYILKVEEIEEMLYSTAFMREDFCEFDMLSGWYPVVYYEDIYTQDLSLTVPKKQIAITNAIPLRTVLNNDLSICNFTTKEPIIANFLIVGNFKTFKETYRGINIEIYSYEENIKFYENLIEEIKFVLDFYEEKFGKYPGDNYILGLLPFSKGPAMCGLYTIKMARQVVGIGAISHESAHKWWGNLVYPKFLVHYGFLTEGLAEYSSLLVQEKILGITEIKKANERIINILKNKDFQITEVKSLSEWSIFYFKSPLVFRMLHWIVGDKNFFKILKTYAKRYKHKYPEIKDFQRVAEEIYGKGLSWFFEPWLNTPGKFDLEIQNLQITEENNYYLYKFIIKNSGDIKMPIDIEILLKGGKKDEIRKIKFPGDSSSIMLKMDSLIDEIIVDPNYWLFDFDRDNNYKKILISNGVS